MPREHWIFKSPKSAPAVQVLTNRWQKQFIEDFYWFEFRDLAFAYTLILFEKTNFCPKIQFWQNPNIFTSFSPKTFLTIFLVKSKLSTAKKSKTTTFSRVFHPEKSTIFSENQSWILGQKMNISNSVSSVLFPCLSSSASVFFTQKLGQCHWDFLKKG